MIRSTILALGFAALTSPVFAATLSSVSCNPVAVTMVFSDNVNDATNATLISLSTDRAGPFTALSSDSTLSIEQDTTITVVLSVQDRRAQLNTVNSGNCVVKIDPAFASGITSQQTQQQ